MAQNRDAPLVPMADYEEYFRVLDCWDCFKARGRMCFDRYYRHMF